MQLRNGVYIVAVLLIAIWVFNQNKTPTPDSTQTQPIKPTVQEPTVQYKVAHMQTVKPTVQYVVHTQAVQTAKNLNKNPQQPQSVTQKNQIQDTPPSAHDLKLESRTPPPTKIDGLIVYDAPSYTALQSVFKKYDYSLQNWTGYAPKIAPEVMPKNLIDVSVADRKHAFIQMMIPLIVHANSAIIKQRNIVNTISAQFTKNGVLSPDAQKQLAPLVDMYRVKGDFATDTADILNTLHYRVQPVPVSLALSQAIMESGWGTSRFAVQGNSLFGQWTFTKGAGLTPEHRDAGKTHMVRSFNSPYDSVIAYILNINRNGAYRKLRKLRYDAIKNNTPVSGHMLAEGLDKYSQLGYEYVKKIQGLIRTNKLEIYNTTILK